MHCNESRARRASCARILSAAALALLLPACDGATSSSRTCGDYHPSRPLLVLESDERSASALARLGTDGCLDEAADVALGSDPTLTVSRGRAFVCNRTAGECFEVAEDRLALGTSYLATASADEPTADAHDLAIDPTGRAWIARFDRDSLAVLSPSGAFEGEASIAKLADADGVPDMESVVAFDDRIFVALERLDAGFDATGPGVVAIVDADSRSLVGSIPLVGENPFGRMRPVASDTSGATVSVATPGRFDAVDCAGCGVEKVDLAAGTSRQVLREPDVGGSITEAILAGPHEGYAIAAGPEDGVNPTWVVAFDPETAEVTRIVVDARALPEAERGFVYWGLALDGDRLLVGDRTQGKARVRAFSRADGREVGGFPVGLYPPIAIQPL